MITLNEKYDLDIAAFQPMEQIRKQIVARIVADTEGKFRRALIELGWTPPKEVSHDNTE
jgi:hypothetical protein